MTFAFNIVLMCKCVLKATRNTVSVPRHWCFKRKYLQGKRGIEKPPFDLPDFIKATGIMEMRQALQEKEDQKTLKAKMRERVRPKMGKIDIDYQKLHDAFFKWQTKPKMTIHGDLYYEVCNLINGQILLFYFAIILLHLKGGLLLLRLNIVVFVLVFEMSDLWSWCCLCILLILLSAVIHFMCYSQSTSVILNFTD